MPYFDETSSLDGVNFTPLLLLLPNLFHFFLLHWSQDCHYLFHLQRRLQLSREAYSATCMESAHRCDSDSLSSKKSDQCRRKKGRDSGSSSRRGVKFTPSKELVSSKYGTPSLPPSRASQRLDESDKLQDQIGLQHLVELMRVFNVRESS